jgi:hypothetical protein
MFDNDITEENIVFAKKNFTTKTETFKKGTKYRCLGLGDKKNIQLMVHAVVFSLLDFSKYFDFAYNVIIKEWTEMGLIVDGQPISKTAFKKRLDCHKYGRGRGAFYAGYIGTPKECLYQFNTPYAEPKTQFIDTAYSNFVAVCKGTMHPIDDKMICRGNSGYPIAYGEIYWR